MFLRNRIRWKFLRTDYMGLTVQAIWPFSNQLELNPILLLKNSLIDYYNLTIFKQTHVLVGTQRLVRRLLVIYLVVGVSYLLLRQRFGQTILRTSLG